MTDVWLVGSGYMAIEYAKVLKGLQKNFICIGNGLESAQTFYQQTGIEAVCGGISNFLNNKPQKSEYAIVCVSAEKLYDVTLELIKYGISNILLEKPGALYYKEFLNMYEEANKNNVSIYIAYNRRFYASVKKVKEIIEEEGGVKSFNFEFTEWSHIIEKLNKTELAKSKWFLGNSTHVVDLAFYLCGFPKEIYAMTRANLEWHPSASIFAGCGVSVSDALFTYCANWESAGRWGVEILTKNAKLILRPLERLYIQQKGSVDINEYKEIEYSMDEQYKPGLYWQTFEFLSGKLNNLCSLKQQINNLEFYYKMADYKKD